MALLIQMIDGVASTRFAIEKPGLYIGRSPENDVYIDDMEVSARHAIVEVIERGEAENEQDFYLKDLDSTNHTYVNDKKIKCHKLSHNDMVRIGLNYFKFVNEHEKNFERTKKIYKSWLPGVYFTK
jgi:pSer/pThr/pTyr-binding forkhead associated (FHA) protein